MPNDTEIAALAAIEDDKLVLATAEYRWNEDERQYDLPVIGKPLELPRELPSSATSRHHQGDVDDEELLDKIKAFGMKAEVGAYGISTFGAVVSDGVMHHAPAIGQKGFVPVKFRKALRDAHADAGLRVYIQNDASAAALGEALEGAGVGAPDFAYLWVGRGVNIGMIADGDIFRARLHPEAGHMPVVRNPKDPLPASTCPTHQDCVIGLCSYISLRQRQELKPPPSDDHIRSIVARYLADLCVNTALFFAPAKIAVGGLTVRKGGLLHGILPEIRTNFEDTVGGYPRYAETDDIDSFIIPATLGDRASLVGMGEIMRRNLTLEVLEPSI